MAFADLIVGKWNRNLFPWFTPGSRLSGCISFVSYIKPQLTVTKKEPSSSCISFVSYIKPQRRRIQQHHHWVVYLSFPTSNHNITSTGLSAFSVVYLSFPTSNHNCYVNTQHRNNVVYLSFPTSNHNTCAASVASS